MTSRRTLLARTAFCLAIANPALAQPFIIPLGRQQPRAAPPPPSPVPVAPPQAGPSSDQSYDQSSPPPGVPDQVSPATDTPRNAKGQSSR